MHRLMVKRLENASCPEWANEKRGMSVPPFGRFRFRAPLSIGVGGRKAGLTDRPKGPGEPEGSPAQARPYGRAKARRT